MFLHPFNEAIHSEKVEINAAHAIYTTILPTYLIDGWASASLRQKMIRTATRWTAHRIGISVAAFFFLRAFGRGARWGMTDDGGHVETP